MLGTGLGLAVTKRIVEAQAGTVGVRSVVGRGSVFFATLPYRLPSAPPERGTFDRPGETAVALAGDERIR
jgi:K+-sensing histidine kinase KdpD